MNKILEISPEEQKLVEEARREKALNVEASSTALPGPARQAFKPVQSIEVGPFTVRPMVDGDFLVFSELQHPAAGLKPSSVAKKQTEHVEAEYDQFLESVYMGGEVTWLFCHVLTSGCAEIYRALKKGGKQGVEDLKLAALERFGVLQRPELIEVVNACMTQFAGYWGTTVGHKPTEPEGEKSSHPPS